MARKSLSKKLRFEIFKRDSFACQYCGKTAPNVVLEVDHIDPVSKDGSNDLFNLITSCYDCNRGKTNIELQDDSVVSKQRNQLQLLQERREQIESMFTWRKGLEKIDNDLNQMVIEYIEDKIDDFTLNEFGAKTIPPLTKKYDLADILESIDLSAEKYLRYGAEGALIPESAEEFLNKVGGILANKQKPPVEQKASYIKGICRNRFNYWDPKVGSIVLNNYIRALRDYGWSEELIIEDLENEIIPKAKEARNWSEWKGLLEKWTNDIQGWGKQVEIVEIEDAVDTEIDNLDAIVAELLMRRTEIIPALCYLGHAFENFKATEDQLIDKLDAIILNYLTALSEYYLEIGSKEDKDKPSCYREAYYEGIYLWFSPINNELTYVLEESVRFIMRTFMEIISDNIGKQAKPEWFEYMAGEYLQSIEQAELNDND
jgi:hypothetical protein